MALVIAAALQVADGVRGAVFPFCFGQEVTIFAPGDGSPVRGTPGDDVILGSDVGEKLSGGGGDDLICGLGGDDKVIGGPGNDELSGGTGNDLLRGQSGLDRVEGGPDDDRSFGGPHDDHLFEESGNHDELYGEGHNDVIEAVGEPLDLPLHNVVVDGGSGDDLISISAHGTQHGIEGGPGNDEISVASSNTPSLITGGRGKVDDDIITGSPRDDVIVGGDGEDEIDGLEGTDEIDGDDGNDNVFGGPGDDVLSGGKGADIVNGEDGDDEIHGDQQDDEMYGEAGVDICSGGAGDDLCDGGEPGTAQNTPDDPDVCLDDVETKRSCAVIAGLSGHAEGVYSTIVVTSGAQITEEWSADFTIEYARTDATGVDIYDLVGQMTSKMSGTEFECTLSADPYTFEFRWEGLYLDTKNDRYSLSVDADGDTYPSVTKTCPSGTSSLSGWYVSAEGAVYEQWLPDDAHVISGSENDFDGVATTENWSWTVSLVP